MKIISFLLHLLIYFIIFLITYHSIKSIRRINLKREKILNIIYFGIFYVFLFLIISIIYLELRVSDSDFNALKTIEDKRVWIKEKQISKGRILDRNEHLIAENRGAGLYKERYYPNREAFVHLVGFSSEKSRIRIGLEHTFYNWLNGESEGLNFIWNWQLFKNKFLNIVPEGLDLQLTLDAELQAYIYDQFQLRPGAATGLNPKTGEILFLVSSPGYSEELLLEKYAYLMKNNCYLFRPVKGRYEPGSIFKVIVAAAAIENGLENFRIQDTPEGFTPPGDIRTIYNHNLESYGNIGLEEAIKYSSNVYFARLGLKLGAKKVKEYAEKFYFNKQIDLKSDKDIFEIEKSYFPSLEELTPVNLAWASIGQFSIIATPFNMAITAAIIANNGNYNKPFLIKGNETGSEKIIKKETSKKLKWMMFEVVGNPEEGLLGPRNWEDRINYGTGYKARVRGILIAGKTGTAENPHGAPHSWFIGFAPVQNPEIAFAVILEHGGTGGESAAKLVSKLIAKAKSLGYFDEK